MWEADYGLGRLWLAARDPHTLHATWDLTPAQVAAAGERLALRLFAGREPVGSFREVALRASARSAFVPVEQAGQWYVATLGFHDAAGQWQDLAQSAPVRMPLLTSREARPEEFVMLTLPPEPEAVGAPPAVSSVSPAPPAPPQPAQPPAAAVSATPTPSVLMPETSLPETRAEAPALQPGPAPAAPPAASVEPAPATRPVTEPVAEPTGISHPSAPRLTAAPAPPWTPAQARAMAAALAALTPGAAPSSAELAAGPGVGGAPGPQVSAGPASPAAPFGFGGEGRPAGVPSSGARPAPGPARRFWFNVHAELIVYGATEPDATVLVDGQPLALRPDGSFTLRFALPDGEYALDATAIAADGAEHRHARLQFARRTHYRGVVGRHPADPALRPPRSAPAKTV